MPKIFGTGGNGGGGSISASLASVQSGQDSANAANEKRYKKGLSVLKGGNQSATKRTGNALKTLKQGKQESQGFLKKALKDSKRIGQGAYRRVDTALQNDLGSTEQQAISRGLGNTTIRNALLDQDKRRANDAFADVDEQVANRRIGIRTNQSQLAANQAGVIAGQRNLRAGQDIAGANSIANFIAARNDVGPDVGLYAQLAQNAEAADQGGHSTSFSNAGAVDRVNKPFGTGGGSKTTISTGGGSAGYSGSSGISGGSSGGSSAISTPISNALPAPLPIGGGGGSISNAISGGGSSGSNFSEVMDKAGFGKGSISITPTGKPGGKGSVPPVQQAANPCDDPNASWITRVIKNC